MFSSVKICQFRFTFKINKKTKVICLQFPKTSVVSIVNLKTAFLFFIHRSLLHVHSLLDLVPWRLTNWPLVDSNGEKIIQTKATIPRVIYQAIMKKSKCSLVIVSLDFSWYSRAPSYTAPSCTDFAATRLWIQSKKFQASLISQSSTVFSKIY